MVKYNLYYNNELINKRPISQSDLEKIKSVNTINKYNEFTKEIISIPTKQIEIITCYVI